MFIWDKLAHHLSFDHILQHNNLANVGVEYALHNLGDMLSQHGKSLSNYNLPEPSLHSHEVKHELAQ
jgi:hypothetical protein